MEEHLHVTPLKVTYLSKVTTAELLSSISHWIEESLLAQLNSIELIFTMADESTDVSSKQELSICGRWLENGKPVEDFLGIVHDHEVNAEALTQYLLQFLHDKAFLSKKCVG